MLVEVGHGHALDGHVVTQTRLSDVKNDDGQYLSSFTPGKTGAEVREHLFMNPGIVTHLPGNTAILDVVLPQRERLVGQRPEWVAVEPEGRTSEEAAAFEAFLADFYGCEAGKPADVEDNYWTLHEGAVFAPGLKPEEISND